MLVDALEYASCGWRVFPLAGKKPRTPHGCKDASIDPSTIGAWWERWPSANLGIATGRRSGLVVLDVDGHRGERALEELQRRFGPLPATREVRTSRGRHLYFTYPDGASVHNSESKIGDKLDVRGDGGYAVAPPSVHPETGRPYEWLSAAPVASLPAWLCDLMTRPKAAARDLSFFIPEGRRNSSLTKIGGRLRGMGLDVDEIDVRLHEVNLQRCVPPLSDAEVSTIARSMGRYPPNNQTHVAGVSQKPLKPAAEAPPAARIDAWPAPLGDAAYHGILGELVRTIEPQTEADPAALLIQFLVMLGNVIGRTAHWCVEADTHYLNLNLALVGATGKGRKGTSASHVRRVFEGVDPEWSDERLQSGLSTGEGLIFAVRDPIERQQPVKAGGRVVDHQTVIDDPGVTDKRLLVLESELSKILRAMEREGNTLSAVVRQAWDGQHLRVLTKNSPVKASHVHISIIGQITRDELLRYLQQTETANGFGNRFLWACTRRSKELPDGGAPVDLAPYVDRLKTIVAFAESVGRITRDAEASALWHRVYGRLSAGLPGLLGAMTARAEAQVMRIASIYAVADLSPVIQRAHLAAALEVWRYCADSAAYIFGDRLGDVVADELLAALRGAGATGLTRTDISSKVFQRNRSAAQIATALEVLKQSRLATCRSVASDGGRRVEWWFASEFDELNEVNELAANGATG